MKFQKHLYLFALYLLLACNSKGKIVEHDMAFDNKPISEPIQFDLDAIKKRGVLKAIVVSGPTSFFIYRGETMGFEYELLKRFTEDIGVKLEIVVANDFSVLSENMNS